MTNSILVILLLIFVLVCGNNQTVSEEGRKYSIIVKSNTKGVYHIELPRRSGSMPIKYDPKNYYFEDSTKIDKYWELGSSNESLFLSIIQTSDNNFYIDKNIDRICTEDEEFEFIQNGFFMTSTVALDTDFPFLSIIELNSIVGQDLIFRQLHADYIGKISIDGIILDAMLISNPFNLSLLNIDQFLFAVDINKDKTIGKGEIIDFNKPIKIKSQKLVASNIVYSNRGIQIVIKETQQDTALAEGFFHPNLTLIAVTDSTKKSLSDFRGKIAIINWWATSCKPCLIEIPELNKIKDEFINEDKLEFIAINDGESINKIESFIETYEFNFTQYCLSKEYASKIGINGIPRTVIIDKSGKVIYDRVGYNKNNSAEELINQIEKALNNY